MTQNFRRGGYALPGRGYGGEDYGQPAGRPLRTAGSVGMVPRGADLAPAGAPIMPLDPGAHTRTTHSQNFYDSVQRNNALNAAQRVRGADFVDAKRMNIAAAQQQAPPAPAAPPAPMVPPSAQPVQPMFGGPARAAAPAPLIPTSYDRVDPVTSHVRSAAEMPADTLRPGGPGPAGLSGYDNGTPQRSNDPSMARARIVTGTPMIPATPGETTEDLAASEQQRMRNVDSQRSRGLGIPSQDAAPFQIRPRNPGTPMIPANTEVHQRDFARPTGAYGLDQQTMDNVNRDAAQRANSNYQRTAADIESGGYYTDQARGDALVGAQATAAQAALQAQQNRAAAQGGALRQPGQTSQPKDTRLESYTRAYQAAVNSGDDAAASRWEGRIEEYRKMQGEQQPGGQQPAPAAPGAAPTTQPAAAPAAKPLTPDAAKGFLAQAGGDKNKARDLARQAGFSF